MTDQPVLFHDDGGISIRLPRPGRSIRLRELTFGELRQISRTWDDLAEHADAQRATRRDVEERNKTLPEDEREEVPDRVDDDQLIMNFWSGVIEQVTGERIDPRELPAALTSTVGRAFRHWRAVPLVPGGLDASTNQPANP